MQQSTILNSEKLRSISHASHTAEVVITALAMRGRIRHFSDIQRMRNTLVRQGAKIVDGDYMTFWKNLAAAGVGIIVNDRKGNPSRFEWYFSMKKVAQAALEGKDVTADRVVGVESLSAKTLGAKLISIKKQAKVVQMVKSKKPVIQAVKADAPKQDRFVYIPLRKDFCLEFTVPSNLSKDEIQVIKNALERLSA